MKTEHKLAETLKTMMSEMSLDDISVTLLAKKCHINRQTFYYHFHDIYDLLTLTFLNEKIPGIDDVKNTEELISCVFNYYQKNNLFINATLNSAGRDLVQEFIYNNCYRSILRFVNSVKDSKKLHANDRKSIARFYSMAFSNSIVYYLSTYKNKTYEGLKGCFAFLKPDLLEKSVQNCVEFRGKSS